MNRELSKSHFRALQMMFLVNWILKALTNREVKPLIVKGLSQNLSYQMTPMVGLPSLACFRCHHYNQCPFSHSDH